VRGLYDVSRERARDLLRIAEGTNDHARLLLAHYAMGETSLHTGEFSLARQHQEITLSLYDEARDRPLAFRFSIDVKQSILSYSGWNLWLLGYPDQAVATGKRAIAFAQGLSHPNSLAAAEFFLNIVRIYRREFREVQETAERVIAFCSEHGFGGWLLFSNTHRGQAIAEQGQLDQGMKIMCEGLAMGHASGADIGRTDNLCHLAEVCMKAGRLDEALSAANEALAAVERQQEHYFEPDIYRVKGEVLLRRDASNTGLAEECFRKAIEIARAQDGRSLELRAVISLARLLRHTGRCDEAHSVLAQIYNWFTEGFDTADLREAKTMLDELSC
jgi:predicted ATPase